MSLYLELVPAPPPDRTGNPLAELTERAQVAEQAGFDAVGIPLPEPDGWQVEPTTVLPALAVRTSRIGLVADVSPSYAAPYNVARYLATLDHVSGGRAGWRIVARDPEGLAGLHGVGTVQADRRAARAAEYAALLPRLWDSWDDDAIPADRDSGVYVRADKIHETRWEGIEFRVRGPLNVPRSPQGHPVLSVEADGGPGGSLELAARVAELATLSAPTVEAARQLLPGLHAAGRTPRAVLTLTGAGTRPEPGRASPSLPRDPGAATALLGDLATAGFDGFRLVLDRPALDTVSRTVLPALAGQRPASGAATLRGRLGLARPADRSGEGAAA